MERKFMHNYRVQFTVEFVGTRRRRTLRGVEETPYIFEAVDSGNLCPTYIDAKNPIRAKRDAERHIKQEAQKIVNHTASKTIHQALDATIEAKGPDGQWHTSKNFYSIRGYRITELIIT